MGEFLEQLSGECLFGDLFKLVGTVSCQPLRGFGLSQPLRTAVQMRIEMFDGEVMRIHDARLVNPNFLQARMRDGLLM